MGAAGALAALTLAAPGAHAAFTTGKCQGAPIVGSGATFQNAAHNILWKSTAFAGYCGAGVTPPGVTWNPFGSPLNGSGYGRRVLGARTSATGDDNTTGAKSRTGYLERFSGSDEPPTSTDVANINRGTDAQGDEGVLHTLPISLGAIAVLVNLPDGCTGFYDAGTNVSDRGNVDRERIQLTGAQVEAAFRGGSIWQDLVPTIAGTTTAGPCNTLRVRRVVRLDDSGSTYAFKDFLRAIEAGFGWLTDYVTPDTRTWPDTGSLVRPAATGGGAVVTTASTTDGSIAYAELATARAGASHDFERQPGADDRYWVQLGTGGTFRDPAEKPLGFLVNTFADGKGANCVGAPISGVPSGADPTLELWTSATAVNGPATYGVCTLTYALAFDDNAAAYSDPSLNPADEESKARTVYDYLHAIVSDFGQSGTALATVDQAPLSFDVRQIAVKGADAIGWSKTPSGSGGGGGATGAAPPPPPADSTPAPPVAAKPSNAFTLGSARTSGTDLKLTLQVPGAGRVVVSASGKPKKGKAVSLGSVTANPVAGGAVRLTLKMSSKARKALKQAKRLRVKITVTFQPTGGDVASTTRTITVKAPVKAKKKKRKR